MEIQEVTVKEHILLTASRLFYQQGYNLTGINQIIEEAGVAKASLYYHYPSKEDLCLAFLRRHSDTWLNGVNQYLAGTVDPKQRVIKTFDYRALYVKKIGYGGCTNVRIISEMPQRSEKIDQQVISHKERQRNYFFDQIKNLKMIDRKTAKTLTDWILLLFDGGTVESQIYRDGKPLLDAKLAVVNLLSKY